MEKKKKSGCSGSVVSIIIFIFFIYILFNFAFSFIQSFLNHYSDEDYDYQKFNIIASTSTEKMGKELLKYADKEGLDVNIEYYGDLEIVDLLNENSKKYDAVWISNSLWLYMLDNTNLTTDSKSIVIDPVVMGIKKSKAQELGFVDKDIYNNDLLEVIKSGQLKYIMASVTKTNTGATSYLTFLNSLAGSPEVLTESMLDNQSLKNDLKSFFKGVERVSGDEKYLETMFANGNYDAMINYESSLISINQELVKNGEEPLYLVYPLDGVAINDMPFAYVNNNSSDTENREVFLKLQNYLRSDKAINLMESYGYRSWYGGINEKADKKIFNPDWGIDTTKYIKDMKYPSKAVINKAISMYINALRKPTHVVFCLDISGSMFGSGLEGLQDAMNFILDPELAKEYNLQFTEQDKVTIISFNSDVDDVSKTYRGNQSQELISFVNNLDAYGGTNIYDPSIKALSILKDTNSDEYTKTVILMTDGHSNSGYYSELKEYYQNNHETTPIYSITFGNASTAELERLASLSNGKVFDGKEGLKRAFMEVRSYN